MSEILLPPSGMRVSAGTEKNLGDVLEDYNADLARFANQVEGVAIGFVYFVTALQHFAQRHGLRPQDVFVDNPRVADTPDGAECRISFRRR